MRETLDTTSWAVTEFADAARGDLRRTQRVVALTHVLAQQPGAAMPEACGSAAMLTAAYRFFTNKDIAPDDRLSSHIEATYRRLTVLPVVLAVHDTTEANWTHVHATTGLGPLGQSACRGLLVHTTVALTHTRVLLALLHPAHQFRIEEGRFFVLRRMSALLEYPHSKVAELWSERIPRRGRRHEEVVPPEREKYRPIKGGEPLGASRSCIP